MEYLNLYAGYGGNRKDLPSSVKVTAIEIDERIAAEYSRQFPLDTVIIADAHEYLLGHYKEFDFIWSSPPCQRNSRLSRTGRNRITSYPDLSLYQEVIFLSHFFKGKWAVENVVPYYRPLIPANQIGRHLFWSNFFIPDFNIPSPGSIADMSFDELCKYLGMNVKRINNGHGGEQYIRNCVHPGLGKHVFESRNKYSLTLEKMGGFFQED